MSMFNRFSSQAATCLLGVCNCTSENYVPLLGRTVFSSIINAQL